MIKKQKKKNNQLSRFNNTQSEQIEIYISGDTVMLSAYTNESRKIGEKLKQQNNK